MPQQEQRPALEVFEDNYGGYVFHTPDPNSGDIWKEEFIIVDRDDTWPVLP